MTAPLPASPPEPRGASAKGKAAAVPRHERLRFTARSLVAAVLVVAGVVLLVNVLQSATRILGWVLAATMAAALLSPAVSRLARRMPRGLAILLVVLSTLAFLSALGFAGYDDVQDQASRLQEAAPSAARDIEASERFGGIAGDLELADRVEDLVTDLPARLRGGDTQAALSAAGSRGIAFLTTAILTLFLVLHGRRLRDGALRLLPDDARRIDTELVLVHAHSRWCRYLGLMGAKAVVVGGIIWLLAHALELPGATLLGFAVGVWSVLPVLGILAGSLVAVGLAAAQSPGRALLVLGLALALQLCDVVLVQRRIDRVSMRVGPAVTLVSAMVGLEAYGAGGMVGAFFAASFVVALAASVADVRGGDTARAAEAILAPDVVVAEGLLDGSEVVDGPLGSPGHEDLHAQG